ncbi:MAG: arginase [Desulfobacterales bacterium]
MKKKIDIIGIPMDLGQSQRGVDMGPGALRYADLSLRLHNLGYEIIDSGNIDVPIRNTVEKSNLISEIQKASELVYTAGRNSISKGYFPIFLGGDHSISIGTIGGISHQIPTGVIWIDAHGDFNTLETSPSANIHGMTLSILTGNGPENLVNVGRPGRKIDAENIVIIGVRSLDNKEKEFLKDSGIKVYTMRDIDEQGIDRIARKAIKLLEHLEGIHVSLDIDSIDPSEAPGVGTPVSGGLSYRESHLMMEVFADTGKVSSMDIVEINPIIDQQNRTADIAVELAASLLGKKIL